MAPFLNKNFSYAGSIKRELIELLGLVTGPFLLSISVFVTARSELLKVLFLAQSLCGVLFVYEISREPLNRFAPNSYRRRVSSLAGTSLKVKVKGQGHQGNNSIFGPFRGMRAVYVW